MVYTAGLAWAGQITLGWLQIRRFNRALLALENNGQICIGRSSGRFKPRVVFAMSISKEGEVTSNFVMKGLTVFSPPVRVERLFGLSLDQILPEDLFPKDKAARQALTVAILNKR